MPPSLSAGTDAEAASTATAIPRSYDEPTLGRFAGKSPRVTLVSGQVWRLFRTAARTLSLASRNPGSGSPTSLVPGMPAPISASISTSRPSMPSKAIDQVRASAISERPHDMPEPRWLFRRALDGDHVETQRAPCHPSTRQPAQGQPADAVALVLGDGFRRNPVTTPGPGLHLTHDECPAVGGEDVQLSLATPPVTFQDHQALSPEMLDGQVLTTSSQSDSRFPLLIRDAHSAYSIDGAHAPHPRCSPSLVHPHAASTNIGTTGHEHGPVDSRPPVDNLP